MYIFNFLFSLSVLEETLVHPGEKMAGSERGSARFDAIPTYAPMGGTAAGVYAAAYGPPPPPQHQLPLVVPPHPPDQYHLYQAPPHHCPTAPPPPDPRIPPQVELLRYFLIIKVKLSTNCINLHMDICI